MSFIFVRTVLLALFVSSTVAEKLLHNMATSYDACIEALTEMNQPTFPNFQDGNLWCNATWDTFLCWPAVPANSSVFLPCPPLRGLLPDEKVEKICHESGRWKGRDDNDFTKPEGYTDYTPCMQQPNLMKKL